MLKRIWLLTKVYVKTGLSGNAYTASKSKHPKTRKIMMGLLYGFLGLYLGALAVIITYGMVTILKPLHQTGVAISLFMAANLILTFFETIYNSANILYFSKDNAYLLPLPLKPWEIVASKLNYLLIFSYISEIFFGLLPMVTYGIMTGAAWYFYPIALVVLLVLPLFPVILACLIVMIVMSFSTFFKKKGFFQVAGVLLICLVSFGISFTVSSSSNLEEAELLKMLFRVNGMVEIFAKAFPTLGLAINALCADKVPARLGSLLILIIVSIALYIIFAFCSGKLYFKGMIGSLYGADGTTNKKLDIKTAYRGHNVAWSYIMKELKMLIRKPIYLTQLILPSLIVPFLIPIVIAFTLMSQGELDLSGFSQILNEGQFAHVILGILMCYSVYCSAFTYIAITAISRDGDNAAFMKYIPVPFDRQCLYKAAPNMLFCLIGYLPLLVLGIIFKLPLSLIIALTVIYLPYVYFISLAGVILDLKKPKLHWSSEYQVVKNNLRIFLILGLGGIACLLAIIPIFLENIPILYIAGIYTTVYLIASILLTLYLKNKATALSANID